VYVVIFRAKVRKLDAEYSRVATRMRELAISQFGCTGFHSVSEGPHEVSLSYWPNEKSIQAWKAHPEHILAQKTGRERWYESYSVQVGQISREYRAAT
jgi:heme-degrading monooxygenase HmoA